MTGEARRTPNSGWKNAGSFSFASTPYLHILIYPHRAPVRGDVETCREDPTSFGINHSWVQVPLQRRQEGRQQTEYNQFALPCPTQKLT